MSIPKKRKEALLRLLDDPNPVVHAALVEEFHRWDDSGIVLLKEIANKEGSMLAVYAQDFLRELSDADPVKAFLDFIRSYSYELETGSLMLSKTLGAKVDVGACCLFLDEMADRCKELLIEGSSSYEDCRVLNRVFFHEYGFVGDVENFYNPENTFMHTVIERRRGIPISLCIIYLLVAYRCGIELEPVGLPGRFMLGSFVEQDVFFIDVYERGIFRTIEDVELMLERNDIELDPSYLTPMPVGDVLIRCCRNLVTQFNEMNDRDKAQIFSSFLDEFEKAYQRRA